MTHTRRAFLALPPCAVLCACSSGIGQVPDFHGRTLEGQTFTRDSVKGRPVLIQFWATWCGYCRRDQATVDALASELHGRLHIVAVNVAEPSETVRGYLAKSPRHVQIVLSSETNLVEVFRPEGFPYYILLGPESELLGVQRGWAGESGLRQLIGQAGL